MDHHYQDHFRQNGNINEHPFFSNLFNTCYHHYYLYNGEVLLFSMKDLFADQLAKPELKGTYF